MRADDLLKWFSKEELEKKLADAQDRLTRCETIEDTLKEEYLIQELMTAIQELEDQESRKQHRKR